VKNQSITEQKWNKLHLRETETFSVAISFNVQGT